MKRSHFVSSFIAVVVMIATSAVFLSSAAHAQNTTSSIRVVVTNESGTTVGGVPVNIRHLPTGRTQTVTSNSAGVVTARGLAIGGPYEVAFRRAHRITRNPLAIS